MSVRDRLTGWVTATFAFVSLCFALTMVVFLGRAVWTALAGAGTPFGALFAAAGCLIVALVFLALAKVDQYEVVSEPPSRRASTRRIRPGKAGPAQS